MYYFPPFYSIRNHSLFFTTSINVIFNLPPQFFFPSLLPYSLQNFKENSRLIKSKILINLKTGFLSWFSKVCEFEKKLVMEKFSKKKKRYPKVPYCFPSQPIQYLTEI